MALTILRRVGKDDKKHTLVLCQCACGRELTLRRDKVSQRQTCGACSAPVQEPPSVAPALPPEPLHTPEAPSEPMAEPERTAEVIKEEIAAQDAALRRIEMDIYALSLELAEKGVEPADANGDSTAKRFRENCTTAAYHRKERKRLERELRDLLGQKVTSLNATESVLERARRKLGVKHD